MQQVKDLRGAEGVNENERVKEQSLNDDEESDSSIQGPKEWRYEIEQLKVNRAQRNHDQVVMSQKYNKDSPKKS